MKRNFCISLLAVCTLAVSLPAIINVQSSLAQKAETPSSTDLKEKVQLLFVQSATAGTFDGKTLTLKGMGPTIFFSDRPERVTGQVHTAEFIKHWDKGSDNFAADPPNATLSIFGDKGVNTAVLELTNPKLTGNTLSYNVKVLKGTLPKSFKESSLFIDLFGFWAAAAASSAAAAAYRSAAPYYYYHPYAVPVPAPAYVAPYPFY